MKGSATAAGTAVAELLNSQAQPEAAGPPQAGRPECAWSLNSEFIEDTLARARASKPSGFLPTYDIMTHDDRWPDFDSDVVRP